MQTIRPHQLPKDATTRFSTPVGDFTLTTKKHFVKCPICLKFRRELDIDDNIVQCNKCWNHDRFTVLTKKSQLLRQKLNENRPFTQVSAQNIVKPHKMRQKTYENKINALISVESQIMVEMFKGGD